jgi:hypothetical protein
MSNQNYVVENEFDFWGELGKQDDFVLDDSHCLLSKEPLNENHIVLPCKHRFNYVSLCKEIACLKYPPRTYSRTINLSRQQICCPYCRKVFDKLLPKIPLYDLSLPKHVCSDVNCLELKPCSYVSCENNTGFVSKYGVLCSKHYTRIDRKNCSKKAIFDDEESRTLFKENTVSKLKEQLRALRLPQTGLKKDLVTRLVNYKNFNVLKD